MKRKQKQIICQSKHDHVVEYMLRMKLRSNSYFKGKKLQKLVESLINLEASNGVDRYIRINKLKNETNVTSNIYMYLKIKIIGEEN